MAKRAAQGSGSITKRTKVSNGKTYEYWEARITVGHDTGTGKQIQKYIYGKTQAEVREKLTKAVSALDQGIYVAPSKITVTSWFNEWLDTYCVDRLKPYTVSKYSSVIRNHISPQIGAMLLTNIKGIHIQRMYNNLLHQGLSAKSIRDIGGIMHKGFDIAVKQDLILVNPCDKAELPKVTQKEIKPLSDAEIPQFLQAIDKDPYCNAFALCLFAGLREAECLGLSWDQIDFDRQTITIDRQLQRAKGGFIIVPFTKSNKPRTIKPPTITFDYLQKEKTIQMVNRLRAGALWENKHNLVFTNMVGDNVNIETFYKHFKSIASEIGRQDARPHDLRHTAATVAIASGADIKSVQSMMGHATASFTLNVYAHTSEKMMEDTAARIQDYYSNLSLK